jgi:hypothetical protein
MKKVYPVGDPYLVQTGPIDRSKTILGPGIDAFVPLGRVDRIKARNFGLFGVVGLIELQPSIGGREPKNNAPPFP